MSHVTLSLVPPLSTSDEDTAAGSLGVYFPYVLARTLVDPTGCWVWTGGRTTTGYGQIMRDGKNLLVHRVAYEHEHGPVPIGAVIRHTCHNAATCPGGRCLHRRCVNPDHLQSDNAAASLPAPQVKTHCTNGHEMTPENTARNTSTGNRYCVTCSRAQSAQWRHKQFTVEPSEVRAWALEQNLTAVPKGRLSAGVVTAWNDAHPDRPFTAPPTVKTTRQPIPLPAVA